MSEIWRTAYEVIRFTNYSFFNHDDYNNIIWLKNEASQSMMLINDGMMSAERRGMLTENVMSRHSEFSRIAGFEIKNFKVYHETSEPFKEKVKGDGIKITHKGISSYSSLINHPYYRLEMQQQTKKTEQHHARKVTSSHPLESHLSKYTPMTYLLVAINAVLFMINAFHINILGSLTMVDQLAVSYHAVLNNDYYRLLSSTFLHSGMEHFLFNMAALFVLGKFVESLYGKWGLLLAYVLTGTLASLFSLMFLTDAVSLGASGAIYGLLGLIVVHLLLNKSMGYKLLMQVAIIFIAIAFLSSLFSNVNHYAHAGGLMAGLLLGVLYNPYRFQMKWYIGAAAAFIAMAAVPIFFLGTGSGNSEESAVDTAALEAMGNGEYEEALMMVNERFAEGTETGLTYFALASLYEHAGEDEKAQEYYDLSLEMSPGNETIVKHRLMELRKNRQYDEMKGIVDGLDEVNDPDLQLIIEELE
ncbi:rhomboid family intramembrane serine protease [Lacicoccus alkaliphilus]|uniref:Membrane associated serine protease, rhomboid family n=1 Tax=Lacicoccus alkaliphilus DSM 16010 TaxID=1123231 RepID=A0A1M7BJM8_9BACL|nr:rhomboid family intramembrane serine protease [Salinicoccus alkaliphilus]SHL54779.1 Membrane associated serine protease, rhomboid family [Salinicoccus alkaliphilus DSM 16010]